MRLSLHVVLLALIAYFFVGFVAAIGGILALGALFIYSQLPSTKRRAALAEARLLAANDLKVFVFNAATKAQIGHALSDLEAHYVKALATLRKRPDEWIPTTEDIDLYREQRPPGPPPAVGVLD